MLETVNNARNNISGTFFSLMTIDLGFGLSFIQETKRPAKFAQSHVL